MSSTPAMVQCAPEVTYVTELICSQAGIEDLLNEGHALLRNAPSTSRPHFFLASLSKDWQIRAIAVRAGRQLVGVIYAKERRVAGFPTGIVYLDATLQCTVLADEGLRSQVVSRAIDALVARYDVRALRVLLAYDSSEFEAIKAGAERSNLEIAFAPVTMHCVLPLPGNYESFVNSLGPRSRRNFRYYRRKFEGMDGEYVPDMPLRTFQEAAFALLQEDGTGTNRQKTKRSLNMIAAVDRPIMSGLRRKDGSWISILGGWLEGESAVVLFQMNNDTLYARASLSIVMRGYMLEHLIGRGINNVFFWAGVSEPLDRHSQAIEGYSIYIDKPGTLWRAFRFLVKATRDLLPPLASYHAAWLVPPSNKASLAAPSMLPASFDRELE